MAALSEPQKREVIFREDMSGLVCHWDCSICGWSFTFFGDLDTETPARAIIEFNHHRCEDYQQGPET